MRGWCHWQAQQAERSEKVTEDEQHKPAGGSRDVCCDALALVAVLVKVTLVVAFVVSVGQRKLRSRNGSEAEGEQSWRTRWTTWPTRCELSVQDGDECSILTWILVVFVQHPS